MAIMNTRVAWALLFSHGALLAWCGIGIWVLVTLPSKDSESPPVAPTPNVTTEPSDDKNRHSYNYNYLREVQRRDELDKYMAATGKYARYNDDPRLYSIVPCGVSAIVAAGLVMAGICSRKTFATTVGLYSSLGLWIAVFVTLMTYQNSVLDASDLLVSTLPWVLMFQVGLLLLLSLQVGLAMWELRRQKTGWPNIYLTHLFTFETYLLVARVTLAAFTLICLINSPMLDGLYDTSELNIYVRYPDYYVLPCVVASLYGLIVSSEGLMSTLLGAVHSKLMLGTTLISAICYMALAVVASPIFVRAYIGPYRMYSLVMIFSSLLSIVSFIHAIACLVFPSSIRTPPSLIKIIANKLSSVVHSSKDFIIQEALSLTSFKDYSAALPEKSKFRLPRTLCLNVFSLVLSLVAIILICSSGFRNWSGIVMMCGDVAVFSRTMPVVLTHLLGYQTYELPGLVKSSQFFLEIHLLLIGSIGSFCNPWYELQLVSGIVNCVLGVLQVVMMVVRMNNRNVTEGTGESEDTKQLIETDTENVNVQQPVDEKNVKLV